MQNTISWLVNSPTINRCDKKLILDSVHHTKLPICSIMWLWKCLCLAVSRKEHGKVGEYGVFTPHSHHSSVTWASWSDGVGVRGLELLLSLTFSFHPSALCWRDTPVCQHTEKWLCSGLIRFGRNWKEDLYDWVHTANELQWKEAVPCW